jgi:hypothetical protein
MEGARPDYWQVIFRADAEINKNKIAQKFLASQMMSRFEKPEYLC